VRYVVQALTTESTRLDIDAVFVEDSRRHPHASDGVVEKTEFEEIDRRLKLLDGQQQTNPQQVTRQEQTLD
jgi:hypothetical protein